jgi:hypothetical protein
LLLSSAWDWDLNAWLLTWVDDADALDDFISQEEAMEMALRETQRATQSQTQTQNGMHGRVERLRGDAPEVPFSDDDYDDIFMGLQGQSQDMDMS